MTRKKLGTKAKIRARKEQERHIATGIFLVSILLIVIVSAYFTYTFLNQPKSQIVNPASSQLKAAIVDHLSLTAPNQTFIQTATNTLKQAGYTVDYYLGENVTVEFYRDLPTHGYKMIILRVHSAAAALEGREFFETPVSFFTSENYSQSRYVWEQLTDQLVIASYSMPQPPYYFGITPNFVTSSMNGNFQNTIIVMMGCEGLNNTKMAEAFVEKGAKVYISWDQPVLASHTDSATSHLLQHFLIAKLTLEESIRETFKEVGSDPVYNSFLIYYPLEAGDYTIQNIIDNT